MARRPVDADLRRTVEALLRSTDIRPWTSGCAAVYARLRTEPERLGKPLVPMDLLIAAQALAEDCTLLTADQAFSLVPGLKVRDWRAGD